MKKFYLFLFLFACFNTQAQITITNADMPTVNDTFRISTINDQWSIDPTLTGANYIWDFSFLSPPLSQAVDTFYAVSSTPLVYQFYFSNVFLYPDYYSSYALHAPDVNIGTFLSMTNIYNFYANDPYSYRQVGFGATISGVPSSNRYSDIDTVYYFPMNYNNQDSSRWSYNVSVPTVLYTKQDGKRVNYVDGWGMLTTPFGTFQSLRVKTVIDIMDSVYLDALSFGTNVQRPQQIEYKWFGQGMGEPLLQINTSFGNITQILFQDSLRVVVFGIEEQKIDNILVYPVPANEKININSDNMIKTVVVYSIDGKLLYNEEVMQNTAVIDANRFTSGAYILKINTVSGVTTKKLLIN